MNNTDLSKKELQETPRNVSTIKYLTSKGLCDSVYMYMYTNWGKSFSCEEDLDRRERVFYRRRTLDQSPAEEGKQVAASSCYGGSFEAQGT